MFQFVGDRTAEVILKAGFEDLPFQDLTKDGLLIKDVWLLDNPDGWKEERRGGSFDADKVMLAVDIPEDALSVHEIMRRGNERKIRKFLVPASLVNSFGPPKIADVDLNWPGLLDDIYTDDIGEDPE